MICTKIRWLALRSCIRDGKLEGKRCGNFETSWRLVWLSLKGHKSFSVGAGRFYCSFPFSWVRNSYFDLYSIITIIKIIAKWVTTTVSGSLVFTVVVSAEDMDAGRCESAIYLILHKLALQLFCSTSTGNHSLATALIQSKSTLV